MAYPYIRFRRDGKTYHQYGDAEPAETEEEAFTNWLKKHIAKPKNGPRAE